MVLGLAHGNSCRFVRTNCFEVIFWIIYYAPHVRVSNRPAESLPWDASMVLQQLDGQSPNDGIWWHLEVYGCRATNQLYSKRFRRGRHGILPKVVYLEGFYQTPQPLLHRTKPTETHENWRSATEPNYANASFVLG